jgi:hypothetical protein
MFNNFWIVGNFKQQNTSYVVLLKESMQLSSRGHSTVVIV